MCVGRLAQHLRPRGRVGMAFRSVEQPIPWKFPSLEANGEVRGKKEEGWEVERPSEHKDLSSVHVSPLRWGLVSPGISSLSP